VVLIACWTVVSTRRILGLGARSEAPAVPTKSTFAAAARHPHPVVDVGAVGRCESEEEGIGEGDQGRYRRGLAHDRRFSVKSGIRGRAAIPGHPGKTGPQMMISSPRN